MLQPLLGSDEPDTRFTAAAARDTQEHGGDDPAAARTEPGSADGNSGPDWATFGETIGDYLIDSQELRTGLRATDDRAQLQDTGSLLFDDDLAEWWPFADDDAGVIAKAGATQGGGDSGPGLGGVDNGWIVPGSAGDPRLGQAPEEDDGPFAGLPGSAGDPRLGQAPEDDDDRFTGPPGSAGDPRLGTSVDDGFVAAEPFSIPMGGDWDLLV